MSKLQKLEVRLEHGPGDVESVGRLAAHERAIYFEYDAVFLDSGRSISPKSLPLERRIFPAPASLGLHGVFADSLPDGWGLLLMDRHFRKSGHGLAQLSPLDRLAYLGSRTMGALTFHPCTTDLPLEIPRLALHVLADEAEKILEGEASQILPQLMAAGGSSAGARPKVLVSVRGDALIYGTDAPPVGYEAWLVKFASKGDHKNSGAIEFVYSRLARLAGLDVPEARLFAGRPGQRFFGVRRFDRDGAHRVHVHTLAGFLDADFRVPNLDYEMFLRVTRHLTRSQRDVERAFRHMLFNILTHNRDDHGKNFSFLMNRDGEWRLSPSYDLTFAEGPGGEHTMTVQGEASRPTWEHMMKLARPASISEHTARQLLAEVRDAVHRWPDEARAVDLPADTIDELAARLRAVEAAAELPDSGVAKAPARPRKAANRATPRPARRRGSDSGS